MSVFVCPMGALVRRGEVNVSLQEYDMPLLTKYSSVVRNAPWAPFPPTVNNGMIESINSGVSKSFDTC